MYTHIIRFHCAFYKIIDNGNNLVKNLTRFKRYIFQGKLMSIHYVRLTCNMPVKYGKLIIYIVRFQIKTIIILLIIHISHL